MSDLIDRQAAKEAITKYAKWLWETYHEPCNLAGIIDTVDNVPTAELELLDDGTLIVTSSKYMDVKRVLVEDGGSSGTLYYPEEES